MSLKFNLKRACASCPFRKTSSFLTGDRAQEIVHDLLSDSSFTCHNTLDLFVPFGG
jgi:hypothetical protein